MKTLSAAVAAALILASPGLEAPRAFAQNIRPVTLSVTSVQLHATPAALSVPAAPASFSAHWTPAANPNLAAPALIPAPLPAAAPALAAARTLPHYPAALEGQTVVGAFDFDRKTHVDSEPLGPGRRGRSRRYRDLLEESSNLNDPSLTAKRTGTEEKPSSGLPLFEDQLLWEIPSSLMTALVLATIGVSLARWRRPASRR